MPAQPTVSPCPRCGDQNWVRLSARPTRVFRIAADTTGEIFTFEDSAPAAEILGMNRGWECAVCMYIAHEPLSGALDTARRVLLAARR